MLKKITTNDLDEIMDFWKSEFIKGNNLRRNESISRYYANVKNKFIENILSTTIYTENDKICGYISVNKENEIWRNTRKIYN